MIYKTRKSGVILIVSLWSLALLSILTVSLSKRAQAYISYAKASKTNLRMKGALMGGVMFGFERIKFDNMEETTFSVNDVRVEVELMEQAACLNLNAINVQNKNLFVELLMLVGANQKEANLIAKALIRWIDQTQENTTSFKNKNAPLDSKEELMLIEGLTPEIYQKIHTLVTIFPKGGSLKIDLTKANPLILRALARFKSGNQTNTTKQDADSLVEKLLNNLDEFDESKYFLNAKEKVLFRSIEKYQVKKNNYTLINLRAYDMFSEMHSELHVVVKNSDLSLVMWRRK